MEVCPQRKDSSAENLVTIDHSPEGLIFLLIGERQASMLRTLMYEVGDDGVMPYRLMKGRRGQYSQNANRIEMQNGPEFCS